MKLARLLTVLLALGIPTLAIADAVTSSDSCCKPGAACCEHGCPMCKHAK
jgi:hypothetical protein